MKRATIVIAAVFIAVSLYMSVEALSFPGEANGAQGPGFFPLLLGGVVTSLSLLVIGLELRKPAGTDVPLLLFSPANRKVWGAMALTALYVALLDVFGFTVVTPVYLACLMWYFGVAQWRTTVAVALLTPLCLYVVFTVMLSVQLPQGMFEF